MDTRFIKSTITETFNNVLNRECTHLDSTNANESQSVVAQFKRKKKQVRIDHQCIFEIQYK